MHPLKTGIEKIGGLYFISDNASSDALDFLFSNFMFYAIKNLSFYRDFPRSRLENEKQYQKELPEIRKKCVVKRYLEEVFFHKHGLRFAPKYVLDYISHKDFLDIGAYWGDSSCALDEYTTGKIISYEMMPTSFKILQQSIKANHLSSSRHILKKIGIGNETYDIKIRDDSQGGSHIHMKGNITTHITTVDDEVTRFGYFPGFIKADVEGDGLRILEGSVQTIKKYRPVFAIAVYHCYEELFEIPEFLTKLGYMIRFELQNSNMASLGEISLLAYPKELMNMV